MREGMETSSLLQLSHMNPSMEAVDRMRLKSLPSALQGMDREERRQFMAQIKKKEEEEMKKKDRIVKEKKKEKMEPKKKEEIESTVSQSKEGPLSRALANEDGFVCVRVGYRDSRFDDRSSLPSHSQTTVVRKAKSLTRNQSRF